MPILGIVASSQQRAFSVTGAYDSIATVTVGSGGASSITFSSIPSTYTHLQIRAIGKGANAGGRDILFQLNSDTGSNYNSHQIYGNGSSAVAQAKGTSTNGWFTYWDSAQFGPAVMDILDYSNTNKNTTTRTLGGHDLNGSGFILLRSGLWMNTSAVTSISFFTDSGNFTEYSQFALYGIKGN
jgi:hypothetical protein